MGRAVIAHAPLLQAAATVPMQINAMRGYHEAYRDGGLRDAKTRGLASCF